jgi:hypothetical protein
VGDKIYGGDERLYLALVKDELTPEQKAELITENHCLHAGMVMFEWFGQWRSYRCWPERWFEELGEMKRPAEASL